jgi:hypothetical protein
MRYNNRLIVFSKKTDTTNGEGSCAQAGTTDSNTFYCGTGPDCNNFAGKSCWNPSVGTKSTDLCSNTDYQCKVCKNLN